MTLYCSHDTRRSLDVHTTKLRCVAHGLDLPGEVDHRIGATNEVECIDGDVGADPFNVDRASADLAAGCARRCCEARNASGDAHHLVLGGGQQRFDDCRSDVAGGSNHDDAHGVRPSRYYEAW